MRSGERWGASIPPPNFQETPADFHAANLRRSPGEGARGFVSAFFVRGGITGVLDYPLGRVGAREAVARRHLVSAHQRGAPRDWVRGASLASSPR